MTDHSHRFLNFFRDNRIISIALASVFSTRIDELSNSIVDNIILPFIDNEGIEEKDLKILGRRIKIGKVILSAVRLVLIFLLAYITLPAVGVC